MADQQDQNLNQTSAPEVQDIQGDVDAIMKKYDRESNVRIWDGLPKKIIHYAMAAFALFLMWMNLFCTWSETKRRPVFLGLVILFVFIIFPRRKGTLRSSRIAWYDLLADVAITAAALGAILFFYLAGLKLKPEMSLYSILDGGQRIPYIVAAIVVGVLVLYECLRRVKGWSLRSYDTLLDIVLALAGSGAYLYFFFNETSLMWRATRITQLEIALGVIGALILFECCRRVVGLPILIVASCFIIYAFYTGKTLKRVVYDLFYTTNGIIGTPIGVCSTYIALFIIFGAFLEATGISQFFIDCANAVAGWAMGGPAKVAVISSALCGMVSGSSVGNTVTTGSVTIPMMKDTGYPPEFAGAVEAASSTGGQIMPPIMGAAAFLMAEMVGVPYSDIVIRAILPAVLYFTGIFLQVHLRAKRLNLKGIPREELPKWKRLLPSIYLLIPLIALVVMIMQGYTMSYSALVATGLCILVSLINPKHRMTFDGFISALETGARNCLSIAIACGVAGIIAGVVTMTGLGQIFISAIVSLANGQLIIALFFTMITCIILGMGVPTTANYIIMATTCAPILVMGMGMNAIAANMFVFYFGIVADITPPVALAAYAGSAIAKAPPMKTAFQATRLAVAAFLVPYIFALDPAMLFINTTALGVVQVIVSSFIGMTGVAAGMEGYLVATMNPAERVLVAAGGLMMLYPGTMSDIIGIALIGAVAVFQYLYNKNRSAVA